MKIFDYNQPYMRFFSRLFDLTMLSLLWLLFSIPLVTMGAATSALYRTVFLLKEQNVPLFQTFLTGFKKDFKCSTFLWLIYMLLAAMLYINQAMTSSLDLPVMRVVRIVAVLAEVTLLFMVCFSFPVRAYYSGKLKDTIAYAFALSFYYFPITLIILAMYGVLLFLSARYAAALVLCLFMGHGVVAWSASFLFVWCFKRFRKNVERES